MRNLILLGLSHATAPLELRERLAFSADQQSRALRAFKAQFARYEALLISTCNRVELYAASESTAPDSSELIDFLCDFHSVPRTSFQQALYRRENREAIAHLFSVAASLDSMVLGGGTAQRSAGGRAASRLAREHGNSSFVYPLIRQ